jgi:hypothetical protein
MLKLQGAAHLRVEMSVVREHATAVRALWQKVFAG